ncbi:MULTISPECIES: hypothetical protein [unclassified Streptomyces]|uniref:hypothetical protein n=1 Tax=unclassified Streptomyces TaxID=2593676 RepID=UPI000362F66A|nr:hypothetical protein [Streptomyces sp. LaPpAH-202]MYW61342.1 hypothetical protein [Streptomyces sp. SID8370]MYW87289.1 hypothetical protein [Streptomyces sp. SID8371]
MEQADTPASSSHVTAAVQARIAAARRKAEEKRRRRADLAERRRHGLEARHAAKLRRWDREAGA